MFKKMTASALIIVLCFIVFSYDVSADSSSIHAKAYILMEASTGRVLESRNMDARLPMASTTKIMTALIALEQHNIQENFVVNSKAIKVEGTSMGLKEGDQVSLQTLAMGMLLASGNDGANAAAVKIGGSIEGFSKIMNERAAKLNMKNSSFVTPSGLHHENHYSSAYDMALLARAALQNPSFSAICSQINVRVEYGNPPYKRTLTNHNRLLKEYEGCIGIKTGFTKKAGRCLVSAASRDGVTLICVTLGAANDWQVHKNLFNQGFESVEKTPIPINTDKLVLNVVGGTSNKVTVAEHVTATAPILSDELQQVKHQVFLQKFYYAPIKKGDVVGEIKHYLDGREIAVTTLLAKTDVAQTPYVEKKSFWEKISDFFESIF